LDAKADLSRTKDGQKPASTERLESSSATKQSKQAQVSGKASVANSEKAGQTANTESVHANDNTSLPQPEVRFFLWDLLKKLFA
jgi:hypothetical protein